MQTGEPVVADIKATSRPPERRARNAGPVANRKRGAAAKPPQPENDPETTPEVEDAPSRPTEQAAHADGSSSAGESTMKPVERSATQPLHIANESTPARPLTNIANGENNDIVKTAMRTKPSSNIASRGLSTNPLSSYKRKFPILGNTSQRKQRVLNIGRADKAGKSSEVRSH